MIHTNWEKELYLVKKVTTDEIDNDGNFIEGYSEPIHMKLNYQPLNAEETLQQIGLTSLGIQRAVIPHFNPHYEEFVIDEDEGSLAYLDGTTPFKKPTWADESVEEPNPGDWANYQIVAIRYYNISKHVYFQKIQGRHSVEKD